MIDIIKEKWTEIISHLKSEYELSDVSYSTWIESLKPDHMAKDTDGQDTLFIIAPEEPIQRVVNKKYSAMLLVSIEEITGVKCKINIILPEDKETPQAKRLINQDKAKISSHVLASANLNPKYTFDTFVVGNNNNLAHAAALAVAESPGEIYNPLFIYGGVGLGKTHLMHSIANFILEKQPDAKVLYVTSETFTNDVIEAIRNKNNYSTTELRNKYRNNDVLLIDDIQFIIGKESTQEEFFHTFNSMHDAKKQIIISSDKPPKDFDTLEERLKSRFEWGLTVDIQSPDYETRMAILRKKEEMENYNIDNEVIKFIATNVKSNIRELEGALTKLVFKSKLEKKDIDISLAEEVVKDFLSKKEEVKITPEAIIKVVSEHYSISETDLKGSNRKKEIVYPRQIAMYLCRSLTDTSLQSIGQFLGGKDHTTVIHGIEKITRDLKDNPELQSNIDIIIKKLSPQ